MPNIHDFYAYKNTRNESDRGGNTKHSSGFGCGWVVIVFVILILIRLVGDGADLDAIDSLLGVGFLLFLLARCFR